MGVTHVDRTTDDSDEDDPNQRGELFPWVPHRRWPWIRTQSSLVGSVEVGGPSTICRRNSGLHTPSDSRTLGSDRYLHQAAFLVMRSR